MSSSHGLWHAVGRVLAWVTLLFAVGTGGIQPLQASVKRCEFSDLETSAIGRFPLFAVPGVERPVLASKPLLVRHDFQHCDGQVSARSRPLANQYSGLLLIL